MSARTFLSIAEQQSVGVGRMDAISTAVLIAPEAAPRDLVTLARSRLERLAEHLALIAGMARAEDSDAAALAGFAWPLLAEVCNLLNAVEAAHRAVELGGATIEEH